MDLRQKFSIIMQFLRINIHSLGMCSAKPALLHIMVVHQSTRDTANNFMHKIFYVVCDIFCFIFSKSRKIYFSRVIFIELYRFLLKELRQKIFDYYTIFKY